MLAVVNILVKKKTDLDVDLKKLNDDILKKTDAANFMTKCNFKAISTEFTKSVLNDLVIDLSRSSGTVTFMSLKNIANTLIRKNS